MTAKKKRTFSPSLKRTIIGLAIFMLAFGIYTALQNTVEDKALLLKCDEVQAELQKQAACSCRPMPKDAYDADQGEVYNKTTRGCSCSCTLPDGSQRNFDIRIAK